MIYLHINATAYSNPKTDLLFTSGAFRPPVTPSIFPSSQTITKVLLQYCALLAKSFPSYCEKEKIVSAAPQLPPPL